MSVLIPGGTGLLIGALSIGVTVIIGAGYFSPAGPQAVFTIRYWSLATGAATPGLIFLLWTFAVRKQSDDFTLLFMYALLAVLADLLVGGIMGFYLNGVSQWWARYLIGLGFGVVAMLWTFWVK